MKDDEMFWAPETRDLLNPAFLRLTKNQRLLYITMRVYSSRKREEAREGGGFTFPRRVAIKYGIIGGKTDKTSNAEFYKDIGELEKNGFLLAERRDKKATIYKITDILT